jgi:cytosine/adenosine deaminase-related metal-dependent hydrolase
MGHPNCVFASHIAETMDELELLNTHTGPFVDFLKSLGVWDESSLASLNSLLMMSRFLARCLLVHCNYLPLDCAKHLFDIHTIVYCPRTHAAFGHPPHPFREFLARGVRVCLGTDSLASNPDLDILAEARFVRSRYPDFHGSQLLKMISLAGAEALGWADECGSLEPGKSADLVVVPLPDRDELDPHDLFLKDDSPPAARRTLFRGQWR